MSSFYSSIQFDLWYSTALYLPVTTLSTSVRFRGRSVSSVGGFKD